MVLSNTTFSRTWEASVNRGGENRKEAVDRNCALPQRALQPNTDGHDIFLDLLNGGAYAR